MAWGFDDGEQDERALREATNGVEQARRVSELIRLALGSPRGFRLTPEIICELNRISMRGVIATGGQWRERDLEIAGSRHVIPEHARVPVLVTEACDFVNTSPEQAPLYLAAYILWRICWVHPFEDGNGRTARAASYLILSVRLGLELPGSLPVAARIKHAPIAYTRALEAADAAYSRGHLDLSALQQLLGSYLQAQLREDPPGLPPGS